MNVIAELFVIFGVCLLISMIVLACILLRELWGASIGRFLDEEREFDDRNIDELCGHDWGTIEDETEGEK
jgi:hypothetical protein